MTPNTVTPMKLYAVPAGTEDYNEAVKVADSWEELLTLLNEDRIDTENNYIITEQQLTVK